MNIKEHIEQGHYPTDEKGRALVPCNGHGGTTPLITIYATDHGTSFPICGRHPECSDAETYTAEGVNLDGNGDLLPPTPRKVMVKRWGVWQLHGGACFIASYDDRGDAERLASLEPTLKRIIVPLTGEYEEPWP